MKQTNTYYLEDYAKQTKSSNYPDNYSPSKQTINNVLNYARALEVAKNTSGKVYFSIIN